MAGKENEVTTFHSENALLQIARWAKVLSWVLIVIYLLSFVSNVTDLVMGGIQQFPTDVMNALLYIANLIYPLALGAFYFLLLNGLAQGLYMALDLYLGVEEEDEEELAEGIVS
jgi:hypothetical protein